MATRNDSWRGGGSGRGAYTLTANSATQTPLTLVLAAGSTANGLRINDSAGSALFTLDASGNLTIAGTVNVTVNEVVTGNIELTGNLVVNGNSTIGNAATDQLNVYANSIFRYNATVWNDLAVNNDVYISHSLNFEDVASTPNSSGNHGKVYTQIVSTLIELHYLDSAGSVTQITSNGSLNGGEVFWADDTYVGMGNTAASPDVRFGWNTTQTVDGLFLGLSDGQNTFIIAENGDRAYDFAHGAQTNPTVYLQSAAQSATEFSAWNAGKISFGLGIATVATDYVVGRNADGTNLLQFNVPTGASFEFSVNDVAQMTMSATAVNFQDNSLTTTGGGSLTGTWTDLGIVTTVDINGGTVDGTVIGGAVAAAGTFTAIVGTSLDLNGALDLDVAALGATITNTADAASSQVAIFEGDRATVADGDEAYLTFRLSDSGGTQDEGARITWKATTVLAGATQDTDLILSALVNNVLTTMLTLDGSANEIVPAVAINSAAAITGTTITATSFVIGANTLTTSEWAFLDGQDQSVFTTSSPTFVNLTITSFAANWTNAGRTVADLGIITTVDINGGTLDGVTIGGSSSAAATFTTITGSTAGNVLTLTNSTDAASVQVGIIQGDRATVADGDEAYLTFRLSDSGGAQDEGARITWKATTVLAGATQDTDLIFSSLVNNVLTTMLTLDGSANEIVPAVAINSAAAITGTTITATSFVIGANTLTTTEWAFLDGQNQSVFTTSNPTFGNLTITSFAANWTNAGRTVADLGIVTTVDINGGTLDGVTIGGASTAAGSFTTITGSTAGNVLTTTNTSDAASVQVGILQGDRATMADNDEAYLTFRLSNDAGTQIEVSRFTWVATDVNAATSVDGRIDFAVMTAGVLADELQLDGTALSPSSNDGLALGTSSLGWADIYLATGANILVNNANTQRTIVLTAAGGAPTTTAGCSAATKVEAAVNDIDYWVLDFDATTAESAFWNVVMPTNWDAGTVTAKFYWTNASGLITETVDWTIAGLALADSDAIDTAFGTGVTTTDTWLAQNDMHISAESSAITIGNTPAAGEWVTFKVTRGTGTDNLTGDARLMMVKILYGINTHSD